MSTLLDDEVVADPIGVIMRLVCDVEPGLAAETIREVVTVAAGGRATRRRLAQSLKDNPQVLRTGRPPAIWSTAKLLLALRKASATGISAPRCGDCGKGLRYLRSRHGGDWSCTPCLDRQEVCAGCGEQRRVVSRDRHGLGRCARCPDTAGDPLGRLTALVASLDPQLNSETVVATLQRATSRPAGQRCLAWAIVEHPDLLTGAGARASTPAVLRGLDP